MNIMAKLKFSVMASALSDDLRNAPRLGRSADFAGLVFDAYSPRLNLAELSGSGRRDFRHMLSAQEQQAHLRGAVSTGAMPAYAMPERFEFVDELAHTSVGKLDKKRLRQMYAPPAGAR